MNWSSRLVHARLIPEPPIPTSKLISDCWAGLEPAEVLDPRMRELLVYELWADGWTDRQIAQHTRLTDYTVCRIRARLRLPMERPGVEAA